MAEEPAGAGGQAPVPSRTAYQFPVGGQTIGDDLLTREVALLVPLLLLVLYIGAQPDPLTARMNPTTERVSTLVHRVVPGVGLGGGR